MVELSALGGNAKVHVPLEAPTNAAGSQTGTAEPKVPPFHQFVETLISATATVTPAPATPDSKSRMPGEHRPPFNVQKRSSALPRMVTVTELTKAPSLGHSMTLVGVVRSTMKLYDAGAGSTLVAKSRAWDCTVYR